jgi:glycine/D-amino acid oxidase-like deaminating enzyme
MASILRLMVGVANDNSGEVQTVSQRVTVIGAGITGLTLGLLCARADHRVTVVDPSLQLGSRSGLMAAPVTVQQELQFHHLWRWAGQAAVRTYAHELQSGQEFVLAAARELAVPVSRADMATVTSDGHEAFWLRYEVQAMRAAGLDPDFTDTTGLPFMTRPQLITADQPMLDPMVYRDALAAAYTAAGGEFAAEVPDRADAGWQISTAPEPVFDRAGIGVRLRPATWNWVAFTADDPAVLPTRHSFGLDDGGRMLGMAGDIAYLGSRRAASLDWVTRHVEDARIVDQWQAPATATFDSMPFVGYAGARSARRLVACGFDLWELTLGTAAALQLAAVIDGRDQELPWRPVRFPRPASVGRAVWGAMRYGLRISPVTPFPRRG